MTPVVHLDGRVPTLTDDDAFDLVMAVAAGRLEVDGIAARLRGGETG